MMHFRGTPCCLVFWGHQYSRSLSESNSILVNPLKQTLRVFLCNRGGVARGWLSGKESTCNARDIGDVDSALGLGRSPGVGNVNPLQHSCLENPMDRGDWWATVRGSQRVRYE